jgi:YYY domain-containing protein
MIADIALWWLVAQLIGLAGLPLASWLLRSLPDRGYAFAKSLGLLLTGYLAWLAAMLGLAPFGAPILVVAAIAVAAIGVWAQGGPRAAIGGARAALRSRLPMLLASEAVFLGAMLAAVWMRAHDPTAWGTERPMDFAFFNAMQRTGSFPPNDPWLAGFSVNYYYFGYLLMAAMALLTGIEPAVAFNLSLALIFALTAQGVAGMIWNLMALASREQATGDRAQGPEESFSAATSRLSLIPSTLFPLLGVIFVLVAANQSGAVQVAVGDERAVALDGRQLLSALGQAAQGANAIVLPYPAVTSEGDFGSLSYWERQDKAASFNWWWPSRSLWDSYNLAEQGQAPRQERRYTITEFPLFSFRLGDMHPHLMALPFGLLAAALSLGVLARGAPPRLAEDRAGWGELALSGIVLGSLYAINSWDLPTYFLLYAAVVGFLVLRSDARQPWWAIARLLLLVAAASYLTFLPFHLTFHSLVGGATPWLDLPLLGRLTSIIAPYLGGRSGLHAFLIIFGLFAVPIVAFVYLAQGTGGREQEIEDRGQAASVLGSRFSVLPWLPPALLLIGVVFGFPLLALAGLGALAVERAWSLRGSQAEAEPLRPAECFALLLAALGCAVLFGTELIYIRDVFEGLSSRMNTIFKFYYQVWLLWGVLAPFALWWALRYAEGRRRGAAIGAAALTFALLAGALVYPWLTLGELGRGELLGLRGRTPRELSPAGEASIAWLRREAAPGSVVLEAADVLNLADVAAGAQPSCGGSYNGSGFGGVSSATGLPTVIGWVGHQQQWRGGDAAARDQLGPRCADVHTIYDTTDPARARELLDKYGVDYIYVGNLERQLYSPESLAKFEQLGTPAFTQDEVTIFKRS